MFSSRSAVRLLRLVLSVSLGRLVKQSVFFRFVRASRLDGSQGGSCSPSRSILFSSYLSVVSHDCWDGGGSSFSSRGGVLSSLLPPVVEFDLAMAVEEMGVPFDDTEGRAVLFSSFSPSRRGRDGDSDGDGDGVRTQCDNEAIRGNGERQRQDDERMSEIIVIDDRYDDGTTRSNSMRGNET